MRSEPPTSVTTVGRRTETLLTAIFAQERERWNAQDQRLGEGVELLADMVMGRGKRLRAAFVYWSWVGTSGWLGAEGADDREVMNACAAFELLQAFALIHDDIMDDAPTRRGVPTIHTAQSQGGGGGGGGGGPPAATARASQSFLVTLHMFMQTDVWRA